MPGSKVHPLMEKSEGFAGSIVMCAFFAALITVLIGGGFSMLGDAEFEFSLGVFGVAYVVLLVARQMFPNLFKLIFESAPLLILTLFD